jgi:hypothetical protein
MFGFRSLPIKEHASSITGMVGVAFAGATCLWGYHQTDLYRNRAAVKKLMRPYTGEIHKLPVIKRECFQDLEQAIKTWNYRTTVVAGLFESGKSTALTQVLQGNKGVLKVDVTDGNWLGNLHATLGTTSEGMLRDVLQEVGSRLIKETSNITRVPILILDIPRKSTADIDTVSTFCKGITSDSKVAHVIVVASAATFALGFDAGGEHRQLNIWIDDFTKEEAQLLLSAMDVPEVACEQILNEIGLNPGNLAWAAEQIVCQRQTVEATIQKHYKDIAEAVAGYLSIMIDDHKKKPCSVGREIVDALLKSPDGTVDHIQWKEKGILAKDVAWAIKQNDAHVVCYQTAKKMWKFSSPTHRRVVMQKMEK